MIARFGREGREEERLVLGRREQVGGLTGTRPMTEMNVVNVYTGRTILVFLSRGRTSKKQEKQTE